MQERLTARTILLNENNQILLLQFKLPDETFWLTPGGKIEDNETPLTAAQRELFEETGISDANFITPHKYYSESIHNLNGVTIFFKEYIFVAYTQHYNIHDSHHSNEEKKIIIANKWWNVHEFNSSNEILYPQGLLVELLAAISNNQIPQETIFIKQNACLIFSHKLS